MNLSKYEVLQITHGLQLMIVKAEKYFGVILSEKLTWNDHMEANAKKKPTIVGASSLPTKIKKNKCCKMLVRPIVEYLQPTILTS